MIAIIDYDAGNLRSVEKALEFLGYEAVITSDESQILAAERVILPGVGSFGQAMEQLRERGLDKTIQKVVESKTPFLGICLGLQLLFEESEESPGVKGLGILPGKIVKIPAEKGLKIPHIGWNQLNIQSKNGFLDKIGDNPFVYFVHSYYMEPADKELIAATTDYGMELPVAVEKDNVMAAQFHPEKSGTVGLQILKNFVEMGDE